MIANFIYHHTPYELRKTLHALICRKQYKKYRFLRESTRDGYSYEPFLRQKCIFIHIPKAAGVSVAASLFGNLGGGHRTVKDYQLIFSEEEFSSFFKFTIVRNPWERVLSAYNFLITGGMHARNRLWAEKNIARYVDFNDFVRNGLCRKEILRYTHFKSQHEYLCVPYTNEPLIDYLGFFENLKEDFSYISYRIFSNKSISLEHRNQTSGTNGGFQAHYLEDTKNIIADIYGRDIELFGYDFDNRRLAEQLAQRDEQYLDG